MGVATGNRIWDPNSWGQYIGGIRHRPGKKFIDGTHIVGQAIGVSNCVVNMKCSNFTLDIRLNFELRVLNITSTKICYTAPYVQCRIAQNKSSVTPWTPLWNLHVHSKTTKRFKSHPCKCIKT